MIQETQEVEGGKVDALVSIDCNSVAGRSARTKKDLKPYACTILTGGGVRVPPEQAAAPRQCVLPSDDIVSDGGLVFAQKRSNQGLRLPLLDQLFLLLEDRRQMKVCSRKV